MLFFSFLNFKRNRGTNEMRRGTLRKTIFKAKFEKKICNIMRPHAMQLVFCNILVELMINKLFCYYYVKNFVLKKNKSI